MELSPDFVTDEKLCYRLVVDDKSTLRTRLNFVQSGAVSKAYSLLLRHKKALIVMTTGTGKTITGSKVIKQFPDAKVLWITQMEELIAQSRDELSAIFPGEVGLFQRQIKEVGSRILVASLQSLEKKENLKSFKRKEFDLIVVDEAHHASAETWLKTITHFKGMRLGLTATPTRSDGQEISDLFGKVAINLSYTEAKKMRLISEETYRVILTNSQVDGISTRTKEYKPADLDRLVVSEERNETIVESYKKYGRTFMKANHLPFKTICFCITVTHAVRMRDLFRRNGITAEVLVSRHNRYSMLNESDPLKATDRKEVYRAFLQSSGAEILCVVNVLNEGKNIPDVGCLLMARPTRSATVFQQQIGRGCRRIEGFKEKFIVLDYVDLMNRSYPPMTLSRITGSLYSPEEIITEYYRGKDPIVLDDYIHYLSPNYNFNPAREAKWTKRLVEMELRKFYRVRQMIRPADLNPRKTGLPSRTTVKKFWPTVSSCFKALRFRTVSTVTNWTKEAAAEAIQKFARENRKISATDLGSKNNLPSQRIVYKFWKTWRGCESALGLDIYWDRESIFEAFRQFKALHGRAPKRSELYPRFRLPGKHQVNKHYGGFSKLVQKVNQA